MSLLLSKAAEEIMELEDIRILMELTPPDQIREYMKEFIQHRAADVSILHRIKVLQMIVKDSFPQYQYILDEFLVLI